MRKRKSGVENLFVSTSEEILIALLDDELSCGELAERVGITRARLFRNSCCFVFVDCFICE